MKNSGKQGKKRAPSIKKIYVVSTVKNLTKR